jgi:hypothetical protein
MNRIRRAALRLSPLEDRLTPTAGDLGEHVRLSGGGYSHTKFSNSGSKH